MRFPRSATGARSGAPGLFLIPSLSLALGLLVCSHSLRSAEPENDDVLAGHSYHGEAFNEGPRQAAYLMPHMGALSFPASTDVELAQKFINQGVAQLHGFWYYEAERSFRQAAVYDPECAIAYWGMAMANGENRERAQDLIQEAVDRIEGVTERERLYIEALAQFNRDEDEDGKEIKKKERAQKYTHDLEEIVEEFPDDVEAKAFLAVQLWQNARSDLPIVSHVAVNSLLQDVFDAEPMHPAHHYRIHLWDRHKPKRALESAALCGQSLPGIAHMWHMPGHIYDKLHRYHDAVWQQEASARVDHAHMMRDRVLPDQIHNFAHNNEWLIRNLVKIGRVDDALSLARNMLELPRHPKYNTLEKRGSTRYGRERLILVLTSYRLWPELLELADTMYLEPTELSKHQVERLKLVGLASALSGDTDRATEIRDDLMAQEKAKKTELEALKESQEEGGPKSEAETKVDKKKAEANRKRRKKQLADRKKQLEDEQKRLKSARYSVDAALAAANEDWEAALEAWGESDLRDKLLKAEWLLAAEKTKESLELIEKEVEDKPGQILPLAVQAYIAHQTGDLETARAAMESLGELASKAKMQTPLLSRLSDVANDLELAEGWTSEYEPKTDVGKRPSLDTLGPFRWNPYLAPDFLVQSDDKPSLGLKSLRGRPTIVIFYLGFGCLHCVEQLHEFSPRYQQYAQSGIDIVGISTETTESLTKGLTSYSKPLEIPLYADPDLNAFHAFRCFDDFEDQPLHGTFLLDPNGRVLWQDISYEPFMDADFLLSESHRLLELAGFGDQLNTPTPADKAKSFQFD